LENQKYLRTNLWWQGNDHIRWGDANCLSHEHILNLHKLLELMETSEKVQDQLIRAEMLRELSRFDEAFALLKSIDGPDPLQSLPLILELAEHQDSLVAVVESGSLTFERGAHGPKEKKKRRRRLRSHEKDFECPRKPIFSRLVEGFEACIYDALTYRNESEFPNAPTSTC